MSRDSGIWGDMSIGGQRGLEALPHFCLSMFQTLVLTISLKRIMVDNQLMITCLLGVRSHRVNVLGDEPRCPTSNMHGGSEFVAKTICSYDFSNHITISMTAYTFKIACISMHIHAYCNCMRKHDIAENRPQTSFPHSTVLQTSPRAKLDLRETRKFTRDLKNKEILEKHLIFHKIHPQWGVRC
jgi:hypothetical protein